MMEEEDYDKRYYQGVLSPLLFFFFSPSSNNAEHIHGDFLSVFPPNSFRL